MARLTGRFRALLRLLSLQASWTYERMQGVGVGFAVEPLLRPLGGSGDPRHREALGRATGFFNANPFLAPAAVGAEARAELDGTPGPQVERLRTALCGPLGSLGDRLFWTGLVPALASATIASVALGAGVWPVLAFVVVHNVIRFGVGAWMLDLGWRHGLRVGAAISGSVLPRASTLAGLAAAALGALALPLAADWLMGDETRREVLGVLVLMVILLAARRIAGHRASASTLTLALAAGVLLWHWSTA
jgi:mannose/fructose/N-acetylgalactosamine-specific phosphotransferase system component IID